MKKAQVYCLGLEWDHHGGSIICAWEGVSWGRGQGWPLRRRRPFQAEEQEVEKDQSMKGYQMPEECSAGRTWNEHERRRKRHLGQTAEGPPLPATLIRVLRWESSHVFFLLLKIFFYEKFKTCKSKQHEPKNFFTI